MNSSLPDNYEFSIVDNNVEYKYKIVKTITNIGNNNYNYIVYKDLDNNTDDDYYVSKYDVDKDKKLILYPVSDNEWDLIDKYL